MAKWIEVPHTGCKIQKEGDVIVALKKGRRIVRLRQTIFPRDNTHASHGMTGFIRHIFHPAVHRHEEQPVVEVDFGSRRHRTVGWHTFDLEKVPR